MNEKWSPIPEWADLYEVSTHGRVRVAKTRRGTTKGKLMSQNINSRGYYSVNLRENKRTKCTVVHRLVVEAFVGQIANGLVVNHIDGNKLNNNLQNLEIVTPSQNMKHACRLGLVTPPSRAILSRSHAEWIRMGRGLGITCKSMADSLGVSTSCVAYVAQGRTWNESEAI